MNYNREGFEKWFANTVYGKKMNPKFTTNSVGDYYNYNINDMWRSWKAAINSTKEQSNG